MLSFPAGPVRRLLPMALPVSLLLVLGAGSACAPGMVRHPESPSTRFVTTAGPNASLIFMARTEDGVVLVDLGWVGADDALRAGLEELDSDSASVAAVFLTHGHRDHIGAWPLVRDADFYLAEDEVPYLHGEVEWGGWIPRWADALREPDLPARGEIRTHAFSRDTTLVVGGDSIHAFLVPGHTAGSAAYLVRETLFMGDAVSWTPFSGFRAAQVGFSDDVRRAEGSLADLLRRVEGHSIRQLCTAHARCTPLTPEFRERVMGSDR